MRFLSSSSIIGRWGRGEERDINERYFANARSRAGDGKLYCIFKSCSDVGEWSGFLPFPPLGNPALMDDEVESIDLGLIANFFEGSN